MGCPVKMKLCKIERETALIPSPINRISKQKWTMNQPFPRYPSNRSSTGERKSAKPLCNSPMEENTDRDGEDIVFMLCLMRICKQFVKQQVKKWAAHYD